LGKKTSKGNIMTVQIIIYLNTGLGLWAHYRYFCN